MLLIKYIFCNRFLCSVILFLIIAVTGLSCGLRIGEPTLLESAKGLSVGCLNGIKEKVNLYIKGQLTADQINQVANCAKTALIIFKDRVHGRKKGEFTPNELRKFIQDVFLQDQIIRDAFLTQLVRFKTVIIGGSEDKLTLLDIERFIIFIDVLKKEAIFFQPYIQALNVSHNEKQLGDKNRLNNIEQDLKKSIARLSVFFKNFSHSYSLADIKALIQEADFFFDHHYNISNLDQKISLIGSLKEFIVRGSDSVIQPNEWEDFLIGCAYWVSASVNYVLLKRQNTLISPEGMRYISVIYDTLLKFLSISLKNHPGHLIRESDFLKIASYLQSAQIIPEQLGEQSIRNIFLIILGKVFNVQKDRYGIIELNFDQLKKVHETTQPWARVQSFLNHAASANPVQESIIDSAKILSFFPLNGNFFREHNLINQMLLLKPLYRKSKKIHLSGDIYVEDKSKNVQDYKNLTVNNFYHLISTMMRTGYEKNYPESPGMTAKELGDFFMDFNIIAVEMGWFQDITGRVLAEGEAEFMVGNMLTPSSKGFNEDWNAEEYLTSNEIAEYLAYAFSFGISIKELRTQLLKVCANGKTGQPNISRWQETRYDISCVRFHLIPILTEQMNNMPDMQKAVVKMSKEQKSQWTEALIDISFETDREYQEATYLMESNLKNIIMSLYFVETTINRYDLNKDLVLQHDEIWAAFPSFKGYLARILIHLLCRKSDDLAPSLYAYVIEKQQLPFADEKAWYEDVVAWMQLQIHHNVQFFDMDYWELYLDRKTLTSVFSHSIKGFLGRKKKKGSQACPALTEKPNIISNNPYQQLILSEPSLAP